MVLAHASLFEHVDVVWLGLKKFQQINQSKDRNTFHSILLKLNFDNLKMPFMIGPAPVRRTLKYLEMGRLILKDSIQILSINYNTHGDHHQGCRYFLSFQIMNHRFT